MAKALIDTFSDEEFARIISESTCYADVLKAMGYAANSGDATNRVRQRIKDLQLSVEHFSMRKAGIIRTPENTFIENSTADQSTLRRLYLKGNYTSYICAICAQPPLWQGKELTLILDHINGHNHDDRLENLRWVCPNCNQQLDTTNGKNKVRKEVEPNKCKVCGKPISAKATLCIACENARRIIPIEEMPVSREELKVLIRGTNFTEIGRKYGVSDNAIRKWCDKYNLPRKVSEIKTISDDKWSKI